MCGIVGQFSLTDTVNLRRFTVANNMVKYRGPDDFGYLTVDRNFDAKEWRDESMCDFESRERSLGALGFRRLSIIDLTSKGHQPMHGGCRKYWIVHNGEVYNYPEIRCELVDRGYTFRSSTDTEVILKSYLEWGNDCLRRFNGMWAFCILDIPKRKLFCACDRCGIKPFYYYIDDSNFVFGSEVKQILALRQNEAVMNQRVFFDYLALGAYGNETRETFFEGIHKILPGEYIDVDLSSHNGFGYKRRLWWDLSQSNHCPVTDVNDTYDTIKFLLEDSIRLRLRSDVPVGTCLSGGLDSSAIVCLIDKILDTTDNSEKHKAFVIGSHDPEIDETNYAKIVIDKTNVDSFIKYPESLDLERELETFIWHHDEPLISASMFGGWQVYKLAKENGVTVVLDGQGSDELLGGYYYGPHVRLLDDLSRTGHFSEFISQLKQNSILHKKGRLALIIAVIVSKLRRFARGAVPWNYHPAVQRSVNGWLKHNFIRDHIGESHIFNKDYYFDERYFSSLVKQDIYELTRFTNLPGILRQVDRNSMAFSIEARVPFLDHRLVEYLYRLPIDYILRDGYTKYAYRQAMRGVIPEQIRLRTDKRGFTLADRALLGGALDYVRDIVDRIPVDTAIYDLKRIRKRIVNSIIEEKSYDPIIWRILNAVLWQSKFSVSE